MFMKVRLFFFDLIESFSITGFLAANLKNRSRQDDIPPSTSATPSGSSETGPNDLFDMPKERPTTGPKENDQIPPTEPKKSIGH